MESIDPNHNLTWRIQVLCIQIHVPDESGQEISYIVGRLRVNSFGTTYSGKGIFRMDSNFRMSV